MMRFLCVMLACYCSCGCGRPLVNEGPPNFVWFHEAPDMYQDELSFHGYYAIGEDAITVVLRRDGKGQMAFQRTTLILMLKPKNAAKALQLTKGTLIGTSFIPPAALDELWYLDGGSFDASWKWQDKLLVSYEGPIAQVLSVRDDAPQQQWIRFSVLTRRDPRSVVESKSDVMHLIDDISHQ